MSDWSLKPTANSDTKKKALPLSPVDASSVGSVRLSSFFSWGTILVSFGPGKRSQNQRRGRRAIEENDRTRYLEGSRRAPFSFFFCSDIGFRCFGNSLQ